MNKFSTSLEQSILDDSIFKNGKRYAIRDRVSSWKKDAHRYFDNYLDKLKQAMFKVFCEDDPKFELDKEDRLYANISGVKKHYSDSIREGMATTLAIIGVYNDNLVNCSQAKREGFAYHIVHDVLASASWKRLVTLNHCLPLFAEASPDAFLEMMDKISLNKQLISDLQTEEGNMFSGGFHWTGIVWALETLAWSSEYIARAVKILAQLSEMEQPSNCHPQPTSALAELFIPWFPQTIASKEKIVATARVLSEQHPRLCWMILTTSLGHICSSGSPLPKIRQFLPTDFKNELSKDVGRFVFLKEEYVKILLDIATAHQDFALNLIDYLSHLRASSFFDKAIQILSSCDIQSMTEPDKEKHWTKLRKLVYEHRKHKDEEWAFSENELIKIDEILLLFAPNCTIYQIKYLFDKCIIDWFFGDNYEEEQKKFEQNQIGVVETLFQESQFDGIYQLIKIVDRPTWLGMSSKKARIDISCDILETLLEEADSKISDFLDGYLKQSYYENKEFLIGEFNKSDWNAEKKMSFILHLPFCNDVWHLAEEMLGESECLYWQKKVFAIENGKNDFSFAIKKALKHGNALLALDCVAWNNHYGIDTDKYLIIKTLQLIINSEVLERADKWTITQIIKYLQTQELSEPQVQEMLQIEFFFLPLFTSHSIDDVSPVFLENAIANDPAFFHQIICALYKSEKKDWQNPCNIPENVSRNLYFLLEEFDTIPGLIDNRLEYHIFKQWYDAVMRLCRESGHEKMAKHTIGKMLRITPKDNNGLWINRDVAELMNADDNDELRAGFYFSTINARGMHKIDFTGKEEQELAAAFRQKASDLEDCGFFSFASTLRCIAQTYEREAKVNIEEGKKRQDEMTLV